MNATLDVSILRKALAIVAELVDEGNFEITDRGIFFQAMDTSHVALVELELRRSGFEKLEAPEPTTIGIKLSTLNSVMSASSASAACALATATGDDDHVTLTFDSSSFKLKLLSIDSERVTIPDSEPDVIATIQSSKFQKIVKDLALFGDTVTIASAEEHTGLFARSEGSIGTAVIELDSGSCVKINRPVRASFATRYLATFSKASGVSSEMSLQVSENAPLCMHFDVGEHGFLRFWLAPKIDDDLDES